MLNRLDQIGVTVNNGRPDKLQRLMTDERAWWKSVAKTAEISAN
ncbi:hypothetical protein [Rhodoplanes sp. Z2-YC6860]|nr:hypothetical protein [Rhodoplanes sp. Z2-YC6860]